MELYKAVGIIISQATFDLQNHLCGKIIRVNFSCPQMGIPGEMRTLCSPSGFDFCCPRTQLLIKRNETYSSHFLVTFVIVLLPWRYLSYFNTRGTKYTIFTKSRLVLKRLKLKTCVTKEIYRCVGGVGVLRFCSCIHPASFHEISLGFYRVNYSYFEAQGFTQCLEIRMCFILES